MVAELGRNADPFMLHIYAVLAGQCRNWGSKAEVAALPRELRFAPNIVAKVENRTTQKTRQSRSWDLSAAAPLFNATTEVRDRFWMNRYGPSRRRALDASAAKRIFVRHPEKTFATISPSDRTSSGCLGMSETCHETRRTQAAK
jgi:hypothetical protein